MERRDDDYLTTHPVAATLRLVHARLAAGEDAPFELLAAGIDPPTREPASVS